MSIIACNPNTSSNRFRTVAEPFLQQEGLPFAEVLNAEDIHQAFVDGDGLFASDDIYSTDVVLWAFLAQTLRDSKAASCAQAVKDIRTYQVQTGGRVPCDNTGDYCRARAKLSRQVLPKLTRQTAKLVEKRARKGWLWHGLHAKIIDGSTFTMPDTLANQEAFPQLASQEPGVGFPIARICVVLSLATACIHDLAMGPYEGKETGETAVDLAEQEGPGVVGDSRIGLTELDGSVKRGLEEPSLAFTHEVHLPFCSCGSGLPLVSTTERGCARRQIIRLANNSG
jgi:putative transposase